MYIIKNALRNISKMRGRSFLIFIIVLVISTSACIALGIQGSAEQAKEVAFENMEISAQISVDRSSMMEGEMDPSNMEDMMGQLMQTLPLEDAITYGEADEVSNFYYTSTSDINVLDLQAYESTEFGGMDRQPMGGMMGDSVSMGSYTLQGSSSYDAMTQFQDGTLQVLEGEVFDIESDAIEVLISEEIAYLNTLEVGDSIQLQSSGDESVLIEANIVGTFACETSDQFANQIFVSQLAFDAIVDTLATSGIEARVQNSPTYIFSNIDDYEAFEEAAIHLGLDEELYTISSQDVVAFEQSLVPLNSLSQFVLTFLIVVLVIGAAILALFNVFIIRERKYEIGVLSAMGMKKGKVASQFIAENIIICTLAIVCSIGVGSVIATPIGESLLEGQIESVEAEATNVQSNFGMRGEGGMGNMSGPSGASMPGMTETTSYIEDIEFGLDATLLAQLIAIGLALSLVTSGISIITILRYEPLKILSER